MDREELQQIDLLIADLLGTDPARCGTAYSGLLALGGFSRPEIHDALERATRTTSGAPAPRRVLSRSLPTSPPPRGLLPGSRPLRFVGTWELGACLGRGAFGFVYRTHDQSSDDLCIKIANAGRSGSHVVTRVVGGHGVTSEGVGFERVCADGLVVSSDEARCRSVGPEDAALVVQAEFAMLRELDSDLFPEVVAGGMDDGRAYYVMERLPGRDLREHLVEGDASSLDWRRLFRRLARELAALVDRRPDFFHGDLKPENIVVGAHRLRLVDPAFRTTAAARGSLTSTLSVPYNPMGMTGERADTGALVITLLELLTGVQPFLTRTQPNDTAAALPLDEYARHASLDPLVATLVRWIAEPPTLVELASALEK